MSGSLRAVGLCLTGLGGGFYAGYAEREPSTLTFLAVGQGDCTVFRHRGVTVLIDAGPATQRSDAGERIVAPTLRKMGVRQVDLVLLSHPDSDHIGGLVGLSKRKRIGKIAFPAHFRGHPQVSEILAQVRVAQDAVLWVSDNDRLEVGGATLHIRVPKHSGERSDNDGSMFVKLEVGAASAVFTGDASMEVEVGIAGRHDWRAQILKAGHHGSRTSTGEAFLKAVSPEQVVLSCGRGNSYGHPHKQVLDRLQEHRVEALRTDLEGHIRFRVGPRGFVRE